ncbi:oxidoreductase [Prosthecomicrobium hirschii]|uniref:Oxidoreductase n=1 Tax=Prosthecodimorpha hirschii TaxID=665126 RepID=A0A0P6VTS4_9HYPH|nr:FAD-binding protein [Prosthecomicrobium hirschii]KPL54658.1 oxidoreductase [Prosthecomicrobium hirschii]
MTSLTADVLVIGGGLAGSWAAVAAARAGAAVILVEKGYCGTSGVTATAGPGHWWVPPDPDLRRAAIDRKLTPAAGLADPDWMARILDLTWTSLPTLEGHYRFSVDEAGRKQYRALRGPEYLRAMRRLALEAGATILDHHPALELLQHGDGSIAGARGLVRATGEDWTIRAGATVLATGGAGFRSHLLGAANNTGDGHLMAAEAGASISGMEFSTAHCIAPARTTMTRSMSYAFARYFDTDGCEVPIPPGPDNNREIAAALLKGPLFCSLERVPEDVRRLLPQIQPNFGLTFAREGVDPFTERFEVTLRGEGTIRGSGGLRIADADCGTDVPGLFAAGDTATRELVAGAVSGGGAINSSWALSSGQWAGRAAAERARRAGRRDAELARPIGQAGLRPLARPGGLDPREVERAAQAEVLPFDKIYFRQARTLAASADRLETLWRDTADHLVAMGSDRLRAREAAALVATARWVTHAAAGRTESRGMHYRTDLTGRDDRFAARQLVEGLDRVVTRYERPAAATARLEIAS